MVEDVNTSNLADSRMTEDMPDDVYYGTSFELYAEEDLPLDDGTRVPLSLSSKLSDDDLRMLAWYSGKNDYLRHSPLFKELDTDAFLHVLFCRGEECELLPFEEEWCEAYEWWTTHERTATRPAQFKYIYNGIAQAIYGKRQTENKNKTFVLTSRVERLTEIRQHPFVIMSPISYTGKRRTKTNARYLYAIGIDIDSVDADNIENLMYQSDPARAHITFPQPQIIVNSGGGIHVYYLLESPIPMFKDAYPILNKIKKELTRRVWNKGTTHEDPNKPQFQGNCQGFRLPGTQTKQYQPVTAFLNVNPRAKRYYTISDLAYAGGGWITEEELELVKKGTYNPHRTTLKQARELWPDWYERRIIQGHSKNRWYIKRDLYDWWKQKIMTEAHVGHRYFCLMALAVYAQKCNISEDEFRADLLSFVDVMDGLSYTNKPEDRFTVDDALDAAEAYKECYCTFPIDDLRAITGVEIIRNQTRKFRKQKEHLKRISLIRDGLYTDWTIGKGRNSKMDEVFEWRQLHPEGTKYACAKELGIDKKTVMKWWETTSEDVENERKYRELLHSSKLKPNTPGKSIGAAANSAYSRSQRLAAQIMMRTDGFDELSAKEKGENFNKLIELINSSSISLADLQEIAGISDPDEQTRQANEFLNYVINSKELPSLDAMNNPFAEPLQKAIKEVEYRNGFEKFRRMEHLSVSPEDCRKYCVALAEYIRTDVLDINFVLYTLHFPNEQIPVLVSALKPVMSLPDYWFNYIIQNGGNFTATEIELPKEFRELVGVALNSIFSK